MSRYTTKQTNEVTSVGSGIGKSACLRIAEEGGVVIVADIRLTIAQEVADDIVGAGGEALAVFCDAVSDDQVASVVHTCVDTFGALWAWLPIRRAGKIREEYGATNTYLISDDSGYVTVTSLPIGGGYLAT